MDSQAETMVKRSLMGMVLVFDCLISEELDVATPNSVPAGRFCHVHVCTEQNGSDYLDEVRGLKCWR